MKRRMVSLLGVVIALGWMGLIAGCEDGGGGGGGGDAEQVLTNPVIPPGVGRDEKARWQNYEGEPTHMGRATAIKWPNSLYTQYGCRPENTRCFVDGTEFTFYAIDVYTTGAQMLSYGCSTRFDVDFPKPFVAVLFKDGQPFCAVEFADPMVDNDLVSPPATIALPAWVNSVSL